MRQPTDEDLILYYYDELDDRDAVEAALADSPELRERLEELRRVLAAVDTVEAPRPSLGFDTRLWARVSERLNRPRATLPWFGRRTAWAGLAAVLVLMALSFLVGRGWQPAPESGVATAPEVTSPAEDGDGLTAEARERILLAAVGAHLERSQRLLAELDNAAGEGVSLASERDVARELTGANRLYRQAAATSGQLEVANVLDDLERFLVELSHSSADDQAGELARLQERLEAQQLLFKVRILSSALEQRAAPALANPRGGTDV